MTHENEFILDLEQAFRTLASITPKDGHQARYLAIIKTDLEKVYAFATVFIETETKTDSTEK